MTEKNAQLEAGLASDLNRELDCNENLEDFMSDILDRAEKYLEDFGSSGKVADCLVQELVEALKNTSDALGFVEQCRKDWAKHTIVLQEQIEQMEKQEPAMIGVFVGFECVDAGIDEEHAKERAKLWNNPTLKPLYEVPNKV